MHKWSLLTLVLSTGAICLSGCNTSTSAFRKPATSSLSEDASVIAAGSQASVSAGPDLIPPTSGNFGGWPMGTTSAPLRYALSRPGANQGVFFEIQTLSFRSGAGAFRTTSTPGRVPPNAMFRMDIEFTPPTDGPHIDTLDVTGFVNEQAFSISIPLSGLGLCTSIGAACDPIGPLCLVQRNSESYDQIEIDPGPTTSPAISRQFLSHNQPGKEYSLPASHLWQLLGLYDRLTEIPGDQCSQFRFSHHSQSRAKADVLWDYSQELVYRGKISEEHVVFTLTLPKQVRAVANVSNAYTELFFLDPATSPTLEVALEASPETPIRKHAIKCISSTAFFATLRSHGHEQPIFVGLDE